jgi:hypothetical protein
LKLFARVKRFSPPHEYRAQDPGLLEISVRDVAEAMDAMDAAYEPPASTVSTT